jgi:hypothetical protein
MSDIGLWNEHLLDVNPVAEGVTVEVILFDGQHQTMPASQINWGNLGNRAPSRVVAYRVTRKIETAIDMEYLSFLEKSRMPDTKGIRKAYFHALDRNAHKPNVSTLSDDELSKIYNGMECNRIDREQVMNQADILKLAMQVGFATGGKGHYAIGEIQGSESVDITDKLTKFAELVTKHEREALSALCIGLMTEETTDAEDRMVVRMVKKIRNRKDNHDK